MKRSLLLVCFSLAVLGLSAAAQETGRLEITVQRAAGMGSLAGPILGANVIVAHWTNPGMHPTLVQDKILTTNQMGICVADLPPGYYDIFVASSELAPAAFRSEIKLASTTSLTANLRSTPQHFRPVQ
jgi:hypothetical protein